MDGCPFHDLDPTETVWISFNGTPLPYSAELACGEYHTTKAVDAALKPLIRAAYERAVWSGGDIPPCYVKN